MTTDLPVPPESRRRRLLFSVFGISVALHGALALLAGAWIVAKRLAPTREENPVISAVPNKKRPEIIREQAIHGAALEGAMARSLWNDKILSTRPAALALPALPKAPLPAPPAASDLGTTSLVQFNGGLWGQDIASGNAAGSLSGKGTGLSFLGIQTNAKRVVLMFDVSKTVVKAAARAGVPMERIREETARLLSNLGVNTRFGLVEFARNYAFFQPSLLPSNTRCRAEALEWLSKYFAADGTLSRNVPNLVDGSPGFLAALEAVFQMQPDSVFVISDGSMQRGKGVSATIPMHELEETLARLQSLQPTRAKVFFVGVGVHPETEKTLRHILSLHGGGGVYSELRP